jgi:hypothetical protein
VALAATGAAPVRPADTTVVSSVAISTTMALTSSHCSRKQGRGLVLGPRVD